MSDRAADRAEYLYSELRKYARESNATLSDDDKDRAILATVAHVVDADFGHVMAKDAWARYVSSRSKHFGAARA